MLGRLGRSLASRLSIDRSICKVRRVPLDQWPTLVGLGGVERSGAGDQVLAQQEPYNRSMFCSTRDIATARIPLDNGYVSRPA